MLDQHSSSLPAKRRKKGTGERARRKAVGVFYSRALRDQRTVYMDMMHQAQTNSDEQIISNLNAESIRWTCGKPPYGFLLPGDPVLPQPQTPQQRDFVPIPANPSLYRMHRPYSKWGEPEFHDREGFQYRRDPDNGSYWTASQVGSAFMVRLSKQTADKAWRQGHSSERPTSQAGHHRFSAAAEGANWRLTPKEQHRGHRNRFEIRPKPSVGTLRAPVYIPVPRNGDIRNLWDIQIKPADFDRIAHVLTIEILDSRFLNDPFRHRSVDANRATGVVRVAEIDSK